MAATLDGYVMSGIWTVAAYLACLLFDAGVHYRVGFAVIYPQGTPAVNPTLWTGLAIRHIVLVPIAFLLQDLARRRAADFEPKWAVLGVLSVTYMALMIWDVVKYYVRPMWRARHRKPDL